MKRVTALFVITCALACDRPNLDKSAIPNKTSPSGSAWHVTEPTLTIGEEGIEEYEFGNIIGLGRLSSKEWVIYDRGARELRFYDSNGAFIRSAGRAGGGPGEFRDVYFMQVVGDKVYTYDQQLRRLTLWNSNGSVRSTLSVFAPMRGSVLSAIGQADSSTFVWMNFVTPKCVNGRTTIDTVFYYRSDLSRQLSRSSGRVEARDLVPILRTNGMHSWGSTLNITGHCIPQRIPFLPGPLESTGASDLHVAERSGVRIIRLRVSSSEKTEDIVPLPRRALQSHVIDGVVRRAIGGPHRDEIGRPLPKNAGIDLYERRLRQLPYPDSVPAIDQFLVDRHGLTWLRAYTLPEERAARWIIVSHGGGIVGELTLPATLRIFEIGTDYIAGVERDELDVQRVVVRGLTRGE